MEEVSGLTSLRILRQLRSRCSRPCRCEERRKAAAKWIADYKNGAKVAAKRGGTTLKEAWARYKARLEAKGRSPTTIEWYREYIEYADLSERV